MINESRATCKIRKNTHGYSIIELLVVFVIITVVFGIGFANLRDFSKRKSLEAAVSEIKSQIRLTQSMAYSAQRPLSDSCNVLDGYRFVITTTAPLRYRIVAVCNGGVDQTGTPQKDWVNLPTDISGVTKSLGVTPGNADMMFKVLSQGTNIRALQNYQITLTQAVSGRTATITITYGGQVN